MACMLIPAAFFIGWDVWFTSMGVWGFNPRYLTGIYLFNLPIEEILFFLCIPYACAFTYDSVNIISGKERIPPKTQEFITDLLIFVLLIVGTLNYDKWYPGVTFLLTSVFLIWVRRFWKPDFLGRFYFAFLFILIPFFIVNGILTGSGIEDQVVWYNDLENLKVRMGTIPVEDTFYGMLLLLMNISIFEFLQNKKSLAE
jgi:lycopene cyclase domain